MSDDRRDGDRVERVLSTQQGRVVRLLLDERVVPADPVLREGERLDPEERVTVCYELHHVLLPELAETGLVEFDRADDEIRRGERFAEARPFLERVDGSPGR